MLPQTKLFESWTPAALPSDLSNLHCLVTGANSGIGFQTARQLALKNANVILVGRNPDKGTRCATLISMLAVTCMLSKRALDIPAQIMLNILVNILITVLSTASSGSFPSLVHPKSSG